MSDALSHLNPTEKRALLARLLRERESPCPASFGQQRLWFLEQLEGGGLYNMTALQRLRGPLRPETLHACLKAIAQRHGVLRSRLVERDGQVWQETEPDPEILLPVEDLSPLSPARQAERVAELADQEQRLPFDLGRAPLFRCRLLRLGEHDHRWLLTVHHAVSDGWSLGVFLRELAALYPALAAGRPPSLPPLALGYADYARQQRQTLQGPELERLAGWWREHLAAAPALLELPADRPRPPRSSGLGGVVCRTLDPALTGPLKTLARQSGTSLFMVGLAAFGVLLHRLTGLNDLVVGSPVANRPRAELEPLIGFFVNTLALRLDLSGDPDFRTLLARVRATALGAFAHQELPFEKLVDELQIKRDLSRNPVFQVMFAWQRPPRLELALGDVTLELLPLARRVAKFDLAVDVWEDGPVLGSAWEYSRDLFESISVERLAARFERLLGAAVANPDQALSRLPLLDGAERRHVLADWPSETLPAPATVLDLFAADPRTTAMEDEERSLSHGELDARTTALARRLRGLGVGPETRIGLCAERSLDQLLALLAILKAGGAYLPLDPAWPATRMAQVLADAGATLLLTQPSLLAALPTGPARVLTLESLDALPDPGGPLPAPHPGQLAYVIYTSGSTGRPKGVMVSHAALAGFTRAALERYGIRRDDRVLQFASLSFDAAAEEIFPTLAAGATLVLRDEVMLADLPAFLKGCRERRLTVLDLPTAFWHRLSAHLERSGTALPASLRLVIIGGEAALPQRLAQWHSAPRPVLLNTYGPTETTVALTCRDCSRPLPDLTTTPIGRPFGQARAAVLDRHLQPLPPGVAGELCLGGPTLARGYLGRPALTAERFQPDPFATEAGARLYRSGDRARRRADGDLEVLGRLDRQLKLRGFRVEPGEIEAVLAAHPQVREAVAAVREQAGEPVLVAYATTGGDPAPDASALRAYLKDRLPHYLLPAQMLLLAELPLATTGKVDRNALPEPVPTAPGAAAPRNPGEHTLATIWAEVLGLERVGIHDNFFELGGDSILAIQVVSRAGRAGLRLSSRQLFQHQTVAELATVAAAAAPPQSEAVEPTGPLPLTPIQQWFFQRDLPDWSWFNQSLLLKTAPDLDPARLEQALAALVATHAAWRLRFRREGAGWIQQVADREDNPFFETVDLTGLEADDQRRRLEAHCARLQTTLDPERGPLLRVAWFNRGPERSGRLLLAAHHLAVDGVSWRILLEDMVAAYGGDRQAPPPPALSWGRWTELLAAHARTPELADQIGFWEQQAQPVATLPLDYPVAPETSTIGSTAQVARQWSAEDTRRLLTAPGTRIQELLLAALALALSRWSGESALRVLLEGHGREELEPDLDLSRTVGWFTTLYPLRLEIPDPTDSGDALDRVRRALGALPGNGLGYGLLRYHHPDPAIRCRLTGAGEPELSFNYLGRFDAKHAHPLLGPAPESLGPVHDPRERREQLIEVNGLVADGRLRLEWTYSRALHREDSIEDLAQAYADALVALLDRGQSATVSGTGLKRADLARLSRKLGGGR